MSLTLSSLALDWKQRWPDALAIWSRLARLRDPLLCLTTAEAEAAGLTGSFAMIRLSDQLVVIDLQQVTSLRLEDLPLEVLAHEVGHHILCPANLTDQGRMLARMRWALPSVEDAAPAVANLYADLHINDRLQRGSGLAMDEVYRRLAAGQDAGGNDLWSLYQRIYEILWALPRGQLAPARLPDRIEGDAQLGSRLVRAYRTDWLNGAAGFAALCLPYLAREDDALQVLAGWGDALCPAGGVVPDGLTELDDSERAEPLHPVRDPRVTDVQPSSTTEPPSTATPPAPARGQHREPFEYGELLRALGLDLTDHEVAVRYYREAARPHIIPFPSRPAAGTTEMLPEGTRSWTVGEPLASVDWLGSVLRSPVVIPGVTTVQRVHGPAETQPGAKEPLDLDLYIDSSGSIANPQVQMSFLALAGTILALSCLRAGGRVQATLWSGAQQFDTTGGFITDTDRILRIVTGYIGGWTAFPIHMLRDTYADRTAADRAVHVLVISDDGVTTMFDQDERGGDGIEIARTALQRARGGGSMVLNLFPGRHPDGLGTAEALGWDITPITSWDELTGFARRFARRKYGDEA